ncbi:MAG: hypothetical protein H5U36_05030 [Candidatus Caldatribacterium sp.]|nr:hypothetical protein [Candidatus Caldatribacterium sp.]
MAKETCAFEDWLHKFQEELKEEELEKALAAIAEMLRERFGARVWFAEILGKRWSHIAGCGGDFPIPPEQILLTPRFGLVAEAWGSISCAEKERLLSFLRDFLSQRSTSSEKRES